VAAAEILLIRHAESLWNAEGRWQGQEDPPLSPRGLEQAAALAAGLAGAGVEQLVSSDLRRARDTAAALARALGLRAEVDRRLRELDVGRWGGRTRAEIAGFDAELLARFDAGDREARAGSGESRALLHARAHTALREILAAAAGRRVALVTHLGWLREVCPGADFAYAECRRVPASPWLAPAR
jgi:probable phosphoglycerate mutase